MSIETYIKKILPGPIKNQLGRLYDLFYTKIDGDMAKNLQEYYGLGRREVLQLLWSAGRLSVDFWRCSNPKTEDEIKKFYEENPFYVFELILWHSTDYQRKLRHKFVGMLQGKVLDYGGGAGDLCAEIAKKGFKADYADLQGRTFEFAKWLFRKKNCNVGMVNLSREKLSEKYDTILCIDVIEHVENPESLLKDLVGRLNENGRLIITALHPDVSKDKPMHFEIKLNPEKYLSSLGMVKSSEPFLWIKRA